MAWKFLLHHSLRGVLRTAQLFIFVLLPGVLLWLRFVGLPPVFHPLVEQAAARAGLELQFSKLTLSIFDGLAVENAVISTGGTGHGAGARVSRALLAPDFVQLLRGRFQLGAIDLHGASLELPIPDPAGPAHTLRLSKANARLLLNGQNVQTQEASFNLQGIDITATGSIRLAPAAAPPTAGPSPGPEALLQPLRILEEMDLGNPPPALIINFQADSADWSRLRLDRISLAAARLAWRDLRLRDLRLEASYVNGELDLANLEVRDQVGRVSLAGHWNTSERTGAADIVSTLNPLPVLRALRPGPLPENLSLRGTVQLQAAIRAAAPPGQAPEIMATGSLQAGPVQLDGVALSSAEARFAWRGGRLHVRDLRLQLPDGSIAADLLHGPGDFRLRLDCQADPLPLLNLLGEKVRDSIAKMELEFLDPPRIRFEVQGPRPDPAVLRGQGTLSLGRTSIHDSPLQSGEAAVSYENLALTFRDLLVTRPEGRGTGEFVYDFGRQEARLNGIRSSMDPFSVLQWIDPKVAAETKPYRFRSPPEVTVQGTVGLKGPAKTRLEVKLEAAGLDYELLDRDLRFGRTSGTLQFVRNTIDVDLPRAEIFGGQAALKAAITIDEPGTPQRLDVTLRQVDFQALTKLYFDYDDSRGTLDARYRFELWPGEPRKMAGRGDLTIEDGNVFAIPILGPLSAILNTIIPGAGYQNARRATCSFRVARGTITTDDLNIIGQGFSMLGEGDIHYLEDRMDLRVRINAQGVPGVLLYPVSKLFEYVSEGSVANPVWRPRNLPKKIFGR